MGFTGKGKRDIENKGTLLLKNCDIRRIDCESTTWRCKERQWGNLSYKQSRRNFNQGLIESVVDSSFDGIEPQKPEFPI